MISSWYAALVSVLALVAPPVPAPTPVVVDIVAALGSGCPSGTVDVRALPDNTGFDLAFGDFIAIAGGLQYRRNCQVTVQVHAPEGMTYAVTNVLFRGFAHLGPTATATLRTRLHYAGTVPGTFAAQTFTGPLHEDWYWTYPIDPARPMVAPCGENRALTISAELRVTAGDDTDQPSWIVLQADSWPAFTTFQLDWSECPQDS